jgi:hypothetical protein
VNFVVNGADGLKLNDINIIKVICINSSKVLKFVLERRSTW